MNTSSDGQKGRADEPPRENPWSERIQLGSVVAYMASRRRRQSIRELAAEIGISKTSVDEMVRAYHEVREPPQPYGNWQKLKDWFLKTRLREMGRLEDPADMAMLFLEVIGDMPEAAQRRSLRKLVDFVGRMYDDERAPHPAWLQRLEAGLRESEGGPGSGP